MIWIYSFLIIVVLGFSCIWSRPLRVYNKGFNTKSLPPGGWTSWFNVDHPGGTGDYETVHSIVRHFGRGCDSIPCRKPIGIKAISVHGKSPFQEGDRVEISPRKGLTCTDSHQSDHRCADYKVRFYCPGMRELCHSKNKTQTTTANHIHNTTTTDKFVKLSHEKKRKHENDILKNITIRRDKKRHMLRDDSVVVNDELGAAFHKHLLWNDRQEERRRAEQWVYKQWKKKMPHGHSKWRNWK